MPEIWSRFFDQVYDPLACNPWAYLRVTLICMELYQELYPVCRSRMMSKLRSEIWSRFFDQVYDPLACNPWAYLRVTLICMELYQELYPVCRSRMMSKLGFGWGVRL